MWYKRTQLWGKIRTNQLTIFQKILDIDNRDHKQVRNKKFSLGSGGRLLKLRIYIKLCFTLKLCYKIQAINVIVTLSSSS